MTGERIREVKEETERQLGRGTGADSFTRRPRLAQGNADSRNAPSTADRRQIFGRLSAGVQRTDAEWRHSQEHRAEDKQ